MKKLLVISLVALTLVGCSKKEEPEPETIEFTEPESSSEEEETFAAQVVDNRKEIDVEEALAALETVEANTLEVSDIEAYYNEKYGTTETVAQYGEYAVMSDGYKVLIDGNTIVGDNKESAEIYDLIYSKWIMPRIADNFSAYNVRVIDSSFFNDGYFLQKLEGDIEDYMEYVELTKPLEVYVSSASTDILTKFQSSMQDVLGTINVYDVTNVMDIAKIDMAGSDVLWIAEVTENDIRVNEKEFVQYLPGLSFYSTGYETDTDFLAEAQDVELLEGDIQKLISPAVTVTEISNAKSFLSNKDVELVAVGASTQPVVLIYKPKDSKLDYKAVCLNSGDRAVVYIQQNYPTYVMNAKYTEIDKNNDAPRIRDYYNNKYSTDVTVKSVTEQDGGYLFKLTDGYSVYYKDAIIGDDVQVDQINKDIASDFVGYLLGVEDFDLDETKFVEFCDVDYNGDITNFLRSVELKEPVKISFDIEDADEQLAKQIQESLSNFRTECEVTIKSAWDTYIVTNQSVTVTGSVRCKLIDDVYLTVLSDDDSLIQDILEVEDPTSIEEIADLYTEVNSVVEVLWYDDLPDSLTVGMSSSSATIVADVKDNGWQVLKEEPTVINRNSPVYVIY